ncbi:MAG: polysaccharide biosynthesis protein [Clostridia bacterium]
MRFKLKYLLLIPIDVILIFSGYALCYLLWNLNITKYSAAAVLEPAPYLPLVCAIAVVYVIIYFLFDMYNLSLRQISFPDLFTIFFANFTAFVFSVSLNFFFASVFKNKYPSFHYSVIILASILILVGVCFVRCAPRAAIVLRYQLKTRTNKNTGRENVMIYGAGEAGSTLYKEFARHPELGYKICCYYDDDPQKAGGRLNGLKIYGPDSNLKTVVGDYAIKTIIIAVPSATGEHQAGIVNKCKYLGCTLKILPLLYDLVVDDESLYRKIRNIDVNDLLGRKETNINIDDVNGYIRDMTILVTGAGGSIGSELCRQIARFKPAKLVLFDIYENNMYDLISELKINLHLDQELEIVSYIGSVRDFDRINAICKMEQPDVIFHAAAHKHVPFMEDSPGEAIKNNIFGTYNVAKAADQNHVKTFVLISTDKAVNPTNVMGTTKRLAEMVIQAYAKQSRTRFVAVRFGNVLNSNGSVVPLFKRQIEHGGPVTVTHPEITRFFMTIPEAARLVIQAGSMAKGGEIFVLDMGRPVKILDLAMDMIRISGYTPGVDMKIEFTGLRPGEKLYEELLQDEEGTSETSHNGIFIGSPSDVTWEEVEAILADLEEALASFSEEKMIECLKRNVPTYRPERSMEKKEYSSVKIN